MTIILSIVAALILVFLAFKVVKGTVRLATLAILVLFCAFVAHEAGAF